MRRKERYIRNAAFISAALTATVDVLRQRSEFQNRGEELTFHNLEWSRTIGRTAVAAAAGAGIGYLYYQYRIDAESAEPFDPDRYLYSILTREHLRNDPEYLSRMLYYRDRTSSRLAVVFNGMLAVYPEKAGSPYKRTAIVSDYDADIILAFKRHSYVTLQDMFADAYETINREFGGEAIITKHRRSIGILFEAGNDQFHIDVVPGREIHDYRIDRRLNLYVNPTWFWQRGSRIEENPRYLIEIFEP